MATKKRFIGIDMSKRSMEVVFAVDDEKKIERLKLKTTIEGRQKLIKKLRSSDVVGLETGNASFVLAKAIIEQAGCKVHVLNAGKLHIIFRSLRKTDKEDALKLAKFIQRTPEEELPVVRIPDEKEIAKRSSVVEQERITSSKTRSINVLHNLFWNAGIVDLKKSDLKNPVKRKECLKKLSEIYQKQANRLNEQIELYESQLIVLEEEQREMLKDDIDQTMILMSVPGVGPKTALAVQAFVGDMDRFDSARQLSYYAGLVPRVDRSGDQNHYGSITKVGPRLLRRVLNQAAWGSLRCLDDSKLKAFYMKIMVKRGKARAIVALSRKILEILYAISMSQTLYRGDRTSSSSKGQDVRELGDEYGKEREKTLTKLYKYKLISKEKHKKLKQGLDK